MLNKDELEQIREAIRSAERNTSGEIRVCVARQCKGDPLEAAFRKFTRLKMETTEQRNGVLIFVSPTDHKAAIWGDSGIHDATQKDFWDEVLKEMLSFFREGRIADGICRGVEKVGELIRAQYPVLENDINELSDDVILEE
jgi:uncharacterized membrane protein